MTKPKPQGYQKINYNNTLLGTFCSSNFIVIQNKLEEKINRDTKIEGNCISENCNNTFNKSFRNLINTNGYCKECAQKRLSKFKKENVENMKNKIIQTCMAKYGVPTFFESQEFKTKSKRTWIDNYGVDNPIKSKIILEKRKINFLKNYGVENPSQIEDVKNKKKLTCLQNHGVEHPQQVPEIAEKASKNSYRRKLYTFPSGNQITCQGYETLALDKLIKEENILENDIVTGCKNVPTIWYNDEECKKHRHYVDIFIPSQNKCIEVKSTWTAKKKIDNIFLKQNAGKELGYLYEIWVYDNKGKIVEYYK